MNGSAEFNQTSLKRIIAEDDPQHLIETAQELGRKLVDRGLTTAQIRNIFGTARRIQANWSNDVERRRSSRRELMLLQPKLEYQSARMAPMTHLKEWLIPAIDLVYQARENAEEENQRFGRFMDFLEAVVAYHTAADIKKDKRR